MQPGKIWVVDDDSAIRWVLERALSSAGYACVCFDSAENALAALNSGQPDVLISDIRMPAWTACLCWRRSNSITRYCR